MLIIPAIDILNGRCVRLQKGEYDTAGEVAADVLETAQRFVSDGAEYIHVVDLDGAKSGCRVNHELITKIISGCGVPVEVGGGIRSADDIDWYINRGASRVILGSAAHSEPGLVQKALSRYSDRIAVGIDARGGFIATEGWTETQKTNYTEFAVKMENDGVKYVIVTDINRDGMLSGVNIEMLSALKETVFINLIASGGVRDMSDIRALAKLDIYGVIAGKSIYSGTLNLKKAIRYCKMIGGRI